MPTKYDGTLNLPRIGPGLGKPEAGGGRAGSAARATADKPSNGAAEGPRDSTAAAAESAAISVPDLAPEPAPDSAAGPGAELAGLPENGTRPASERKIAANQANAQKSTGPRTEEGKRRSSLNGLKRRSTRLLGLAEARTLRQEPGAAEKLYRELIAPYEPAPALLRAHMEDFARLRLELEAWERIRDARLEARWEQSDVDRRRAFYEMQRDLPGKAEEVLERGVFALKDSPAKFRKAAECLDLLNIHLAERDFDVEPILRLLYGKKIEPASDRAQTICIRCQKLASTKGLALNAQEFEDLKDLVDQELRDALDAYGLHLDEKTITRTGRLSRLGPTREDQWMNLQGERLRRAIDRKQWVITGLLQILYRSRKEESENSPASGPDRIPPTQSMMSKPAKPTAPSESTKRSKKVGKTKPSEPNRSQSRGRRR